MVLIQETKKPTIGTKKLQGQIRSITATETSLIILSRDQPISINLRNKTALIRGAKGPREQLGANCKNYYLEQLKSETAAVTKVA